MNLTQFYASIYSAFGVPANLTIGADGAIAITVNDLTKGVDIPDPANPGVKTLRPVARVRVSELDAALVDRRDLDGAALELNGITWTISAWGPRPSPNGEADGEIEMILLAGEPAPTITLSASSILDTAQPGDSIGTFSMSESADVWIFTLTDDANGRFAMAGGSALIVGLAELSAGSFPVTVSGTNGVETITHSLLITVLPDMGANVAPQNTQAPLITGFVLVGQTLTADPGVWIGTPTPSFAYQWFADGVAIGAATSSNFVITVTQAAAMLTVSVSAVNSVGSAVAVSGAVGPVISDVPPSNVDLPTIAGLAISAQVLTGSVGGWSGSPLPSFTYRWLADGVAIGGATGTTYTLTDTEIGKVITFEVSATNTSGGPVVAVSAATAAVVDSAGMTIYVRRVAAGSADGSSWANARGPAHLGAINWTPGSLCYLRADEGNYSAAGMITTFSSRGTTGNPIAFRGVDVDLNPMLATIKGTRGPSSPEWSYSPTMKPITTAVGDTVSIPVPAASTSVSGWYLGQNVFTLANGADYFTFENIRFERVSQPFTIASSGGTVDHLTLNNIDMFNVREGVFQQSSNLTNLAVTKLRAVGFSKKIFRPEAASHDWLIQDIHLDSGWQDGDSFANGVAGDKTSGGPSYNLTFKGRIPGGTYDGFVGNCYQNNGTGYWNGDSFAFESNQHTILIQDCIVAGNTDAGVDSKAANTTLLRVTSRANKRNFKSWYGPFVVQDCLSQDPHLYGGTGGRAHFTTLRVDLQIKDSTVLDTIAASAVWASDTGYGDCIVRLVNAVFTGTGSTAPLSGQLQITCPENSTSPGITSPTSGTVYGGQTRLIPLTADKGVSWKIVGGADRAQYLITNGSAVAVQAGQFLHIAPQTYVVSGYNDRVVQVRAEDANGNTATLTYTMTILAGTPPYTMQCLWEGANNATTCFTEGGRTVVFSGGAKLSTAAPLQGSSSLLLAAASQKCSLPDSADWHFTGTFSLLARISSTGLGGTAAQTVMAQYAATSGQRSWDLKITTAGALVLVYSIDGNAVLSVSSAAGVVTAGIHELAADRDASNVIRLYVDGVMVGKATAAGVFRASPAPLTFGNNGSNTAQFIGKIDNTRIWNGYSFCGADAGYTP